MTKDTKIARIGEKTENGEVKLVSTFTEVLSGDDFNERMIRQSNMADNLEYNLNITKSQIARIDKEVVPNAELEDFAKKLKDVEKLRQKNDLIEQAKNLEKQLTLQKKDLVSLRVIQSDLKLIEERKGVVQGRLVGEK